MNEQSPSYWVAYYYDFSGIAIFGDEVTALRYAVANHMEVKMVGEGVDLRELLK